MHIWAFIGFIKRDLRRKSIDPHIVLTVIRRREWPRSLVHKTYLASLPPASNLSTPLYFTESELQLLSGSNLLGAVEDRRKEWSAESEVLRSILNEDGLTWERYLATATYMSSRAFPSKLLDLPSDSEMTPQSTRIDGVSKPVLLPGVDIFNRETSSGLLGYC